MAESLVATRVKPAGMLLVAILPAATRSLPLAPVKVSPVSVTVRMFPIAPIFVVASVNVVPE